MLNCSRTDLPKVIQQNRPVNATKNKKEQNRHKEFRGKIEWVSSLLLNPQSREEYNQQNPLEGTINLLSSVLLTMILDSHCLRLEAISNKKRKVAALVTKRKSQRLALIALFIVAIKYVGDYCLPIP